MPTTVELIHSGHVERRGRQLRADAVIAREESIAEETAIALMYDCTPCTVTGSVTVDPGAIRRALAELARRQQRSERLRGIAIGERCVVS